MLRTLHIRNLAVIDELNLELDAGFSVLTGETGAGKSILIDALGLVTGARADAAMVRAGCDKAEVTAEFDIAAATAAEAWLEERELADDSICIVRRVVQADGRTRAFVNGRPVSATELRGLGEHLVEIFGQGESQTLMRPEVQRSVLDDFGGHAETLATVAAAAAEVAHIDADIERVRNAQQRDPSQLEFLSFQLRELDALALQPGEVETLDGEHRALANAGKLIETGGNVTQLLYGGDAAIYDQLSSALTALGQLSALHSDFGEAEALVATAQAQVSEAADSVRRVLDRLDLDPERLAEIERRIAAIHDLARKHRVRANELVERREQLRTELSDVEGAAQQLEQLAKKRETALAGYRKHAAALSRARSKAASALADAVTGRVRELGMPNARFLVVVESAARERPSASGDDNVRFDFSANPGQPPRPLAKVASGGELSRVSLAVQVSVRQQAGAPTMVFDEVDAGIGGGVAEIVGKQLRALGDGRQVLCVTHLAQVAAQGGRHYAISKSVKSGATFTRVAILDAKRRIEEVARMIGGEQITSATTALAKDLLKLS
jgi:DNA repair protein RecN (Recombination protein N)